MVGIHQLSRLDEQIQMRNRVAQKYNLRLKQIKNIKLFKVYPNIRHGYYKYPILLDEAVERQSLIDIMKQRHGVSLGSIYYPPCHLQPFYQDRFGFKLGMLPVSEDILKRVIALPIFAQMTDKEIDYVVNALRKEVFSGVGYLAK